MTPALAHDALDAAKAFGSVSPDKFHQLVRELSLLLGPSSGLTCADVDVSKLHSLMERYTSNETEWQKYAFADYSRGYTRNLVDEGNGKSNLLVLVWTPGKGSPIHDHADAHCLMKVLKGSLREIRYEHPSSPGAGPRVIKETLYAENEVNYMSDELGLHRITNENPNDVAVSLHCKFCITFLLILYFLGLPTDMLYI